jgi:RecA-family ATPase
MAVDDRSARPSGGPTYYEYHDVSGNPIFRVVRRDNPKRFFQQRWDAAQGKWIKGLDKSTIRVLYNLPGVFGAAIENGTVYIFEGEKDADRARNEFGLTATTNPGGAGKWRDEYAESLRGVERVVIVYDLDQPDKKTGVRQGQHHALEIERSLVGVVPQIEFAAAAAGNDFSNHLDAGKGLSDLVRGRPGDPLPERSDDREAAPERGLARDHEPAVYQLALERLRQHARENNLPMPVPTSKGWEACCPAHEDHDPSLGIMVGDEQPLVVNCQANCTAEEIADALGIDFKDMFEEGTPDHDAALEKEIQRQRNQRDARYVIAAESAPDVEVPTIRPDEYLDTEEEEVRFSIEKWHVQGGNTLIVAQYKTGKTSLAINLYRSLVNTEPFLGAYKTNEQDGRIAYFDYEMLEDQFRFWLKAGGDINLNKMATPWHLRGRTLPIWDDSSRKKVVEWLRRWDCSALIVDTAARAWSGLVESENSNADILRFTDSLDSLKYEAGLTDLFLITHMGRSAQWAQDGEERARGATRLEDWMDTGWYMTKDENSVRYLRANGRGVDQEPIMLNYAANSHRLTTQGIGRQEHEERTADEMIVDILAAMEEPPTTAQLKELVGGQAEKRASKVMGAERRGLIERNKRGRAMIVELTETGRKLQSRHRNAHAKAVAKEAEEAVKTKDPIGEYKGKRARRRRPPRKDSE